MKKSNNVTSLRSSGISTLSARGPSRADPPSEHEPPATSPDSRVSSEVVERARRRGFTAEYKYRILREATAATGRGEMGALLRREGLYSSHLTTWRIQAGRGEMAALKPQQRGPKPVPVDARDKRIAVSLRQACVSLCLRGRSLDRRGADERARNSRCEPTSDGASSAI
jgi:transposase-like protein